jgi:isopentenyldiphosphate isomerase
MLELLNIVNDNDEIIGEETRDKIHRDGLLHREIHVYFITPNKEIIFQHRVKNKDTYPDLLDATVSGHVEIGHSYEKTALKETDEETGIKIKAADLVFVKKIREQANDIITGKLNNVFQESYIYFFKGKISDLKIETGKALGFELWPIEKLSNLNDSDCQKFIPHILEFSKKEIGEFLNNLS